MTPGDTFRILRHPTRDSSLSIIKNDGTWEHFRTLKFICTRVEGDAIYFAPPADQYENVSYHDAGNWHVDVSFTRPLPYVDPLTRRVQVCGIR